MTRLQSQGQCRGGSAAAIEAEAALGRVARRDRVHGRTSVIVLRGSACTTRSAMKLSAERDKEQHHAEREGRQRGGMIEAPVRP